MNYLHVLLAGDHGHARGEVAGGAVRGRAHPRLVVVEGVVLLHDLLGRRQRDLDGALDHRNRPFLQHHATTSFISQRLLVVKNLSVKDF